MNAWLRPLLAIAGVAVSVAALVFIGFFRETGRQRLLPLLRPLMKGAINPRTLRAIAHGESNYAVVHHVRASLWEGLRDAGRGVPNGRGSAHPVAVRTRDGLVPEHPGDWPVHGQARRREHGARSARGRFGQASRRNECRKTSRVAGIGRA